MNHLALYIKIEEYFDSLKILLREELKDKIFNKYISLNELDIVDSSNIFWNDQA